MMNLLSYPNNLYEELERKNLSVELKGKDLLDEISTLNNSLSDSGLPVFMEDNELAVLKEYYREYRSERGIIVLLGLPDIESASNLLWSGISVLSNNLDNLLMCDFSRKYSQEMPLNCLFVSEEAKSTLRGKGLKTIGDVKCFFSKNDTVSGVSEEEVSYIKKCLANVSTASGRFVAIRRHGNILEGMADYGKEKPLKHMEVETFLARDMFASIVWCLEDMNDVPKKDKKNIDASKVMIETVDTGIVEEKDPSGNISSENLKRVNANSECSLDSKNSASENTSYQAEVEDIGSEGKDSCGRFEQQVLSLSSDDTSVALSETHSLPQDKQKGISLDDDIGKCQHLSQAIQNILKANGILTYGDILDCSAVDLENMKNMTPIRVDKVLKIKKMLKALGISREAVSDHPHKLTVVNRSKKQKEEEKISKYYEDDRDKEREIAKKVNDVIGGTNNHMLDAAIAELHDSIDTKGIDYRRVEDRSSLLNRSGYYEGDSKYADRDKEELFLESKAEKQSSYIIPYKTGNSKNYFGKLLNHNKSFNSLPNFFINYLKRIPADGNAVNSGVVLSHYRDYLKGDLSGVSSAVLDRLVSGYPSDLDYTISLISCFEKVRDGGIFTAHDIGWLLYSRNREVEYLFNLYREVSVNFVSRIANKAPYKYMVDRIIEDNTNGIHFDNVIKFINRVEVTLDNEVIYSLWKDLYPVDKESTRKIISDRTKKIVYVNNIDLLKESLPKGTEFSDTIIKEINRFCYKRSFNYKSLVPDLEKYIDYYKNEFKSRFNSFDEGLVVLLRYFNGYSDIMLNVMNDHPEYVKGSVADVLQKVFPN